MLLAACTPAATSPGAGPPTPSVTAAAAAPDAEALGTLAVEIRQSRADWGDRVVQLRVVNDGDAPLVVVTGSLTTPTAAGTATSDRARSRAVPAGTYRDFSVALGDAVCPAGAGPVAVDLVVAADASGGRATATVTPSDPQGHLARIHGEDCAARAVAAGAVLSIGPRLTPQDVDGVLTGSVDLTVRPVPGGPDVAVTAVDETILLAPTSGTTWTPAELVDPPPDGATATLAFTPGRCDPHAVAEDKRGTFFGVHASVDGVPQPVFYLGVDDGVRGQVYDYVAAACGWPAG
jgi:hypothetical protein